MKKSYLYLPVFFALVFIAGIWLGKRYRLFSRENDIALQQFTYNKFNEILNYVTEEYVDSVNRKALMEVSVNIMLQDLDPHSIYISAEELQELNEPLEGNFEGIGIEFNIINDTIVVISPIAGGPSEALGIRAGDRIVMIEDKVVAGTGITNKDVIKKLRGERGTKVRVAIERKGERGLVYFTITRDKIPITSVDACYMVNDVTGYIRISRFGSATYEEFTSALDKLIAAGAGDLIIDLRGNPGGYLNAAVQIADEFLEADRMIVYTEGRARPKQFHIASAKGRFEKGKLMVLIDEGSASASEILAGAVQDNDRGILAGRYTFGKGLVQEQSTFPDGSAIRLTVARYYTPAGRCIQRDYHEGAMKYYGDHYARYFSDERFHPDSARLPDSLKYTTYGGRTVYGGGGIMPDIFIPADTSGLSPLFAKLINTGILSRYGFYHADNHRQDLKKLTIGQFVKSFDAGDNMMNELMSFAAKEGVVFTVNHPDFLKSETLIRTHLKAYIARHIYGSDGYYPVIHTIDPVLKRALELLGNGQDYSGILASGQSATKH